jgi:hypothetical protein
MTMRYRRALLLLATTFAAAAMSSVVAPGPAGAVLVPCDPILNCPEEPVPPREWVAVGLDRNLGRAYDEAVADAENSCPGHAYTTVRLRLELQDDDVWKATLTYYCG